MTTKQLVRLFESFEFEIDSGARLCSFYDITDDPSGETKYIEIHEDAGERDLDVHEFDLSDFEVVDEHTVKVLDYHQGVNTYCNVRFFKSEKVNLKDDCW
jgi:hypothetical protein